MASINVAARNAQLTAFATRFAAASLVIYAGTPPADADTALSGNTVLATHTLAGFGTASAGSITASAIASATIAASGTATFARATAGSETMQLSAGTSGTDIVLDTTTFTSGNTSNITSLTLTQDAV